MKKYLLFDLDGTLTDPKIGITTCVQYALHSFGIEEPDLDKLEPFIGPPLRDSFMEFYGFTAEQAEEAVAKYRERFQNTGIFENEVYAGIPEMLKNLQSKGYFLALASSKPQIYVERILEHFDLEGLPWSSRSPQCTQILFASQIYRKYRHKTSFSKIALRF